MLVYIYLSSTASLHALSFLFVYMRLSVWLLQIYPFAIFFYLSGSSRFGYLSVDLSIDLSIVLSISLLTYLRTWFINMNIYIYSILFYLYHLVIISLYSYCQTICKSPISVSSIYILQFLPVCTYFSPYFFCLCVSLSCACLSVVFSKDLGPGKYTYDPRI